MENRNTPPPDYTADLNDALNALKTGQTILYPTDTIWGLGCDATNESAVQKIMAIKNRDAEKSFIVLVSDLDMLCRYVDVIPLPAITLMEYAEKPLTIIYDKVSGLAESVYASDGSVGIRWCKDAFCQALIRKLKKPIVSTSANFSGMVSPSNFSEVSPQVIEAAGYVVKHRQREKSKNTASTIFKIKDNGQLIVIRK